MVSAYEYFDRCMCGEDDCQTCGGYDDFGDDEDEWECAYDDKCLVSYTRHLRSECHTVEDMEAQAAEMRQEQG